MSSLDLRSGYFQLALNPSDIVKMAFVTKNDTYAFKRMPFGLSGAAPNFQKAIDIILKTGDRAVCIRHVKTAVYRPQANRTERVNHDLVQMITNYVKEQHDTWDQFLREFAYAIRTAVNEATGKPPA
ncbi:hypothetical protein TNCV_3250351 [Trichonephila clavipes]|nr:hypothetical protein TNCV_3250351 [Trichonephila clavipes]